MKHLFTILFAILIMIVFPSFMAWIGFGMAREASASLKWPSVKGQVVETSVNWYRLNSHAHLFGRYVYEPVVSYTYQVDDMDLKNSFIGFGDLDFDTKSGATDYLEKHWTKGDQVDVYYDPDRPHHACLITGHSTYSSVGAWVAVAVAAFSVTLFGLSIWLRVTRWLSKRKHSPAAN